MVIAGHDKCLRQPLIVHKRLRVAQILSGIKGTCFRDNLFFVYAALHKPITHDIAFRARLVASLRAADDHHARFFAIFLQSRRQPAFQRDGRRAVRLDLCAKHNDGIKVANRRQMCFFIINETNQPRRSNRPCNQKSQYHHQQPPQKCSHIRMLLMFRAADIALTLRRVKMNSVNFGKQTYSSIFNAASSSSCSCLSVPRLPGTFRLRIR